MKSEKAKEFLRTKQPGDTSCMKYRAKRISPGHYIYRGYKVNCIGYYEPDHSIVWEAVDEKGCGFAHSFSFRDTKMLIDLELERSSHEKDNVQR